MVTSDRGARLSDDVGISQLGKAGLPAPSLVRPTKLATIEPARVVRVAGALTRADLQAVITAVQKYLSSST